MLEGLQHWSVIMQKNDDAYLLYFMKLTVSLSLKRHLQLHSFFLLIQGSLCHRLDVHYYVLTAYVFI